MSKTLVLVAESSRAKLYSADTIVAELVEKEDLIYPEGRSHENDLVSDGPGSDGGSVGQGRHVLDSKHSATEATHEAFAKMLVDRLEQERSQKSFDRLVLMASPAFLGILRKKLNPNLASMVAEEIDKNLVQRPSDEIRSHISILH